MESARILWLLNKRIYRAIADNSSVAQVGNITITKRLLEQAMRGDSAAQYRLGRCYAEDHSDLSGFESDVTSRMWLQRSAEGGYVPAMLSLGRAYFFGDGVDVNIVQGIFWMMKAANLGNVEACTLLGMTFYNGTNLKRQYRSWAVKWFRNAANRGCLSSMGILGSCYRHGIGVGLDLVKCCACYSVIIARSGDESGVLRRFIRETTLTDEQSLEVHRLSIRNPASGLNDL